EDTYFCGKVIDAGYQVLAHGGVLPWHFDPDSKRFYEIPTDSYPMMPREDEYITAPAMSIEGWMTPNELHYLAKSAAVHKEIVEIGSYLGRSTRALCDNTKGHVTAIDDWRGPRDTHVSLSPAEIKQQFESHLSEHIKTKRLDPVAMDYAQLREWIPPKSPDMIFLDGSHASADIKRDIEWAERTIAPGGLICGHDANWPQVNAAVAERFPKATVADGTTIWQWQVPVMETVEMDDVVEISPLPAAQSASV